MKWPGCIVPYITLTREAAKDIIWPPLRELSEAANLPLRFKENTGEVILPNGSKIILRGVEDRRQAEKLRGPKYPFVAIDEAQGIPRYLVEVIFEILKPATSDYPGSQICITGTPNSSCVGAFYDAVHNLDRMKGWEVHIWTIKDNVCHARHKSPGGIDKYLLEQCEMRGLTMQDPPFMREWLGLWVKDSESSVYKYKPRVNDIFHEEWRTLRDSVDDWEYVMGLDLGWNDPSAFVVSAWSQQAGRFVVVDSFYETEMSTDSIARKIGHFFAIYGDMPVVTDTGGYGKSISEELAATYSLPIVTAEKTKKATYIEFMNSDLRAGAVKFLQQESAELTEQLSMLQWDDKSLDKGIPKEDKRSPNHLSDATLYSWRSAWHQAGEHEEVRPMYGSREWSDQKADERYEEAIRWVQEGDDIEASTESWLDSLL